MMSFRSLVLAAFVLCAGGPGLAQTAATPQREYRVLLVGNSLTYTNNLPALLRAVGASQGVSFTTETYAAPGGTLAERVNDEHAANALRARKFDVVLLQEQGGRLAACPANAIEQRKAPCGASMHAYRDLASIARDNGAAVLLFNTWASNERSQARISRSTRMLAEKLGARVFNAAGAIDAMRNSQPDANPYPDGTHPSTRASLMLALVLYRDITGSTPVAKDLRITAPLLPVNAAVSAASPMESQPGLAGDGKAVLVPASLLEPLVRAIPGAKPSGEMDPSRRRR